MYDEKKRREELPRWRDIQVDLEVPSGYSVLSEVTDEMYSSFEAKQPKIPDTLPEHAVIRPFSYFKLDGEYDESNPPILTITYTHTAWNASKEVGGGGEIPRVFYRKYDDSWGDRWEEISPDYITETQPKPGELDRTLTIRLPDIPDPAIGGC